jgi:hypothetical protein
MWEEGDGPQDNTFVKRKVAKVLKELISDERMAGRQHFGFKLNTDANGGRVLGGDANGSLSFETRTGPVAAWTWNSSYFHRSVHRCHVHQARDPHSAHIQ